MWSKNWDSFLGCESEYGDAEIVLYGAPFDSTTSFRPGARFGSSAIRHESFGLETYSPYLNRDLTEIKIYDKGDLELPFGSTEDTLAMIEETAGQIFSDGKTPFLLGGEHLVTLGAVRAAVKKWPELCIMHFDAHTDLREEYLGVRLSHASVIRRCHELIGDGRIFQFGIRSGERVEFEWAGEHTELHKFGFEGLTEAAEELKKRNAPVYFTIDLDVLDPSVFPGTGTPEAGGVAFMELFEAMKTVTERCRVVGCDMVELAPQLDPTGASTATACKAVRELLLMLD